MNVTRSIEAVEAVYDENGDVVSAGSPEVQPTYTTVTRNRTWTATGTTPKYQTVDQSKLIPILTKALQEALIEIDNLKARLDVVEGN